MASLPSLYSSMSGYRPRSPQGDGSPMANGMQQIGQMGAFGGGATQMPQTAFAPRRPQQVQGGQGQLPAQGGAQTFGQMQNQGLARPTPQMVGAYRPNAQQGQATDQLQQAVAKTLQTPSRYDLGQVQQVRDAFTNQLNTEFGAKRKEIDETLAKRGLLSSSYAGGYYGDLAGQQANAMGTMNASLIQDAAKNWSQDNATALNAAGSLQSNLANQGVAGYTANLAGVGQNNADRLAAQRFGLDAANQAETNAMKMGELTGTFQGQQTQAAKQFDTTSALDRLLGVGKLNLDQQAQTNQATQFGQTMAQNQDQFAKNLELQRAELTQKYGAQEADRQIEAQKVANQQSQFGQNLGFQQQQLATQNRQADLDRALQELLGVGGLDVKRQEVANQQSQFGQSLAEQTAARLAQTGISQQEVNLKAQQIQQDAVLQGRAMTIQEAQNLAQNQLEAAKMTQQGQQFTQSQTQQQQQFDVGAKMEQAKLALDQMVQSGQLTLAQKDQALRELSNAQTNVLEQQKLAQQGSQFTASQSQQMQQFLAGMDLDKAKLALDSMVQTGQLSVQQAQQALAEKSQGQNLTLEQQKLAQQQGQFDTSAALDKLKLELDNKIQTGQLTVQQAAQKLDEARLASQNTQFGQTLQEQIANRLQSGSQFQQGLSLDQAKLALDKMVQTGQLTIQQAAQKLAELSQQQQNALQTSAQKNQVDQFGRTMEEQIANRQQQNTQFNAGQTQNQQQFNQTLITQLASILGNKDYVGGNSDALTKALEGILSGSTAPATSTPTSTPTTPAAPRGPITATGAWDQNTNGAPKEGDKMQGGAYTFTGGQWIPTPSTATPVDSKPKPTATEEQPTTTASTPASTPAAPVSRKLGGVGDYASWMDPATGEAKQTPIAEVPAGVDYYASSKLNPTGTAPGGMYGAGVTGSWTPEGDSSNPLRGYTNEAGGSFGGAYAEKGPAAKLWGAVANRDLNAVKLAMTNPDPQLVAMATEKLLTPKTEGEQAEITKIIRSLPPEVQEKVRLASVEQMKKRFVEDNYAARGATLDGMLATSAKGWDDSYGAGYQKEQLFTAGNALARKLGGDMDGNGNIAVPTDAFGNTRIVGNVNDKAFMDRVGGMNPQTTNDLYAQLQALFGRA